MITLKDCMRAISAALEEEFGAAPITKDIRKGFQRPATFLQPVDISTAMEGVVRHDEYRIEIIRFSPEDDRGYIDLLTYQERLRQLLARPIPVTGRFALFPEDVDYEIVIGDYALVAAFNVDNYQIDEDAASGTGPAMLVLYENDECLVPPGAEPEN